MASSSAPPTGAHIVARALRDLGVTVVFGIVGIPVIEIAEQAANLGIRFIGFRNEQAAGYAATATEHEEEEAEEEEEEDVEEDKDEDEKRSTLVGNSSANAFPMLLLAGSSESHLVSKGGFQELDAISLLTSHTKLAIRPPSLDLIPDVIQSAYRSSFYGRPGTGFVDLPADLIQVLRIKRGYSRLHNSSKGAGAGGLRSTSLGWEVAYEKIAEACGGLGFVVRTPEELERATVQGFKADVPVVVNVMIESGKAGKLEFGWQASAKKGAKKQAKL
ncbi:hypothetical protein B0A49_02456 [Cryomyces minteri]|uniref:Thiamine pyrophosphate enzyme N-terminal TPP-binding domain-containing protein n=1 Tax=Cryomyces minteri TaxID=331657 RepID=A0A4U0XQY5_9PEZI|nr:hypothetical protein B0A49_02456 [Cryomyces minteri]